jgi:transcriptional regulator with XRE-family HTH domain
MDTELIRVGNKVISRERLNHLINRILQLRAGGSTQVQVAEKLGVDRSFISHLEGLGEVRVGRRVALLGFPIANIEEVASLAKEVGVDYIYLLSQSERDELGREMSGAEVFNEVMEVMARLVDYDIVVFLGSDWRISLMERIFGSRLIGVSLGKSPLKKSVTVDLKLLEEILSQAIKKRKWGRWREKGRKRKPRFFKKRSSS